MPEFPPTTGRFCVFDRLTFPALAGCVLKGITSPTDTLYFIDAPAAVLPLARLILGKSLKRLDFKMVDIRDEQGTLIRLRLPYFDLNRVCATIMEGQSFSAEGRQRTFLLKRIASVDVHGTDTIYRAMYLVHVTLWAATKENRHGAIVLFLRKRLWMKEVINYGESAGVKIVSMPAWDLRAAVKNFLLTHQRILTSIQGLFSTQGIKGLWARHPSSLKSPQLAVDYYGHLNLDQPHLNSDLFFWQKSTIDRSQVLVAFSLPQAPLDEVEMSSIGAQGMNAVATNLKAWRSVRAPLFQFWHWPWKATWTALCSLVTVSNKGRWIKQQIARYHDEYGYWHSFFGRYGVKVFVSWYKHNPMHCAMADALNAQGGVMAIYQRSYEEMPSSTLAIAADLVFSFSPSAFEVERKSGSVIPYQVAVGYIGDHRFTALKRHAQAVREQLHSKGAQRIIAYLDENSLPDARWHTGHEFMRENYAFILERLLNDKALGLVFKPKVPRTLHLRLGPVAPLLDRALGTGRCFMFQGGALHGSFPPAAAALASDMVIHGHLDSATAGIECVLAGAPTLLLDREGWPVSRLHALGKDAAFTNWNDLWQALEHHWRTPGGNPRLGDWSSIIHELDPFRDGRAAERMGSYLQWILEGLNAGRPREAVLADAAERYAAAWGKDKIAVNR